MTTRSATRPARTRATTNGNGLAAFERFNWQPQPKAWKLVNDLVNQFLARNTWADGLARQMKDQTGTRFVDWVDHIAAPESVVSGGLKAALLEAGFRKASLPGAGAAYVNPDGLFPPIVAGGKTFAVGIKVESVVDFLQAHTLDAYAAVRGSEGSRLRIATLAESGTTALLAVERHGLAGFKLDTSSPAKRLAAMKHLAYFRTRRRHFFEAGADLKKAFAYTFKLVDGAVRELGRDWTCDLWFKAEREYWMSRNRAAQVQYARQQRLGLGWANHDHHTYRSSRDGFTMLVKLWEKLGLVCRERFYAGAEAGWGAQVLEQPVTGIITFNDVDMSPEELMVDFAHKGFTEKPTRLGTVGLWAALHGEAVFEAGMHHLEAQFDWHALVDQLERAGGIKTMSPFTTFPYLRQAFTEGERWTVTPARVDALLASGLINQQQAELFKREGALGSHLENLERNDGFKGFNQQGVSDIIARTDPRRQPQQNGTNGVGHT